MIALNLNLNRLARGIVAAVMFAVTACPVFAQVEWLKDASDAKIPAGPVNGTDRRQIGRGTQIWPSA